MSLLIFEDIHYVMIAEEILKEKNIEYRLVPIPKVLSKDCGMALEVDSKMKDRVSNILKNAGITTFKVYDNSKYRTKEVV